MELKGLVSWDDFPRTISKIDTDFGLHRVEGIQLKNRILYRGQSDSEWPLKSTLERYSSAAWSVESYHRLLQRCAPEVESFTSQSWSFDLRKSAWQGEGPLPNHELWVYMRHCGFPSPLLDWTMSPYIAAFFAFEEHSNAHKAAIFVYIEHPRGSKGSWEGEPQISIQNVHVKTHKRHFLQQSCYTICTQMDENKSHRFVCHEQVFDDTPSKQKRQDVLFKITIPREERLRILSYLNEVNINHFSLFQSEESLMLTLAFRKIDLKDY